MEKDLPNGYKGWPLEDTIRTKGSKDNTNILKAFKAINTPIIVQLPYSKYRSN
jgi:hypothetical protein